MSSLMLFAERIEDGGFPEKSRTYVADKALKMLDWVAMITSDRKSDRHAG